MDAFVIVSKPRWCAIAFQSNGKLFFDVITGQFANHLPQVISQVNYLYNDEVLYANLRPEKTVETIDWTLDDPLKWKSLRPPEYLDLNVTPVALKHAIREIPEKSLSNRVKRIIEAERKSFGLDTKWRYELDMVLSPLLARYEADAIAGKRSEIMQNHKKAIKRYVRPLHSVTATPAMVHSRDPCEIFRALMNTRYGLDILSVKEQEASFALALRCEVYPEGVFCVWSIFAVESKFSLELNNC
jgi:hypothetical protein